MHACMHSFVHHRVVWAFGGAIFGPICDVTPTHLTTGVIATLREADYQAHNVLSSHGKEYKSHDYHVTALYLQDCLGQSVRCLLS